MLTESIKIFMSGTVNALLFGFYLACMCCVIFSSKKYNKSDFYYPSQDSKKIILESIAFIILSLFIAASIFYNFIPQYLDHVEAEIGSISFVLYSGGDIYPIDRVYGLVYGPLGFVLNSLPIGLFKTIWSTKILGTIFYISSIVLLALLSKRIFGAGYLRIFLLVALLSSRDALVFSNRPEAPLLFLASIASLAAVSFWGLFRPLIIGLCAGLSISLKIYGIVYIAPAILFLLLCREDHVSLRLKNILLISLVASLVIIWLYSLPGVSINGYLGFLHMTTGHSIGIRTAVLSSLFGLIIIALCCLGSPAIFRKSFFWVLCTLIFLCLVVVSCKSGAGPHYLIPFIPCALLLIRDNQLRWDDESKASNALNHQSKLFLTWGLFFLAPLTIFHAYRVFDAANDSLAPRIIQEVKAMSYAYPMSEMGVSDNATYQSAALYYPLFVFQNKSLVFNTASWMDMQFGGVNVQRLSNLLDVCRIPFFIIPKGRPFSIESWYTGRELFDDQFRSKFQERYRLVDERVYFDIYKCVYSTG